MAIEKLCLMGLLHHFQSCRSIGEDLLTTGVDLRLLFLGCGRVVLLLDLTRSINLADLLSGVESAAWVAITSMVVLL